MSYRASLCGILTIASLSVFAPIAGAAMWNVPGPADWNTGSNWDSLSVPADFAGFANGGTATLSSAAPDLTDALTLGWPSGGDPSGHLIINSGGSLKVVSDTATVGHKASNITSTLTINGGSFLVDRPSNQEDFTVGDEYASRGQVIINSGSLIDDGTIQVGNGGNGEIQISGGSMLSRRLWLGKAATGSGTLTIVGTGGSITTVSPASPGSVVIGQDGNGTLNMQIGASGISPIVNQGGDTVVDGGAGTATLNVSLIGLAPQSDLLLIDNQAGGSVLGAGFDALPQGASINATYGLWTYTWTLDYFYGNENNDVALTFVSAVEAPEPASLAGAVLAASFALVRRRRR